MTVSRRHMLLGAALLGVLTGCGALRHTAAADTPAQPAGAFEVTHTDQEWRQRLSAEQYDVLRHAGTEMPFSSALNDEHRTGVFGCAGCALDLFSSATKFDSGTGWPSFWKAMDNAVIEREDTGLLHVAHRGVVPPLRRASRTRLRRRPRSQPACATA